MQKEVRASSFKRRLFKVAKERPIKVEQFDFLSERLTSDEDKREILSLWQKYKESYDIKDRTNYMFNYKGKSVIAVYKLLDNSRMLSIKDKILDEHEQKMLGINVVLDDLE